MKPYLQQRNNIVVVVLSLLLITVAFFGVGAEYILYLVIGVCVALACYAHIAKDKFDRGLFGVLAIVFILSRLYFHNIDDQYLVLRTTAITAFGLLQVVLLIGPWARFSTWVRAQYKHRRHLGVTIFFLAATHAAIAYRNFIGGTFDSIVLGVFTFFGFIALYIFAIMALTSRDHVQNHWSIRVWSIIHTAVILGMAGFIWYYYRLQTGLGETYAGQFAIILPIVFVIFGFTVAPYSIVKLFFYKVNGWKQIHVLIYIAYIALMFHTWVGMVYIQPFWIQALLWGSFLLVVGSHVAGWVIKWKEDRYFRGRVTMLNLSTLVNGLTFVGVARTDEFTPMKGEKFIVNNVPIAVFLFKGEFKAISNICAHQKGPLYQGILTAAGYVICPWHQYGFSVVDGKGPKGYSDSVPAYQIRVVDNIVYVSV